jgi:hypothetical protein
MIFEVRSTGRESRLGQTIWLDYRRFLYQIGTHMSQKGHVMTVPGAAVLAKLFPVSTLQ